MYSCVMVASSLMHNRRHLSKITQLHLALYKQGLSTQAAHQAPPISIILHSIYL